MNHSALRLEGISKRFGSKTILEGLSLEVASGEIVAVLGASGSGKTTMLRLIAGTLEPDAGRLLIAGQDMTRAPPEARRLGYVFQDYALWPHLTVLGNLELVLHREPKQRAKDRALNLLKVVGLEAFASARPEQLSGGQRQRVALARALAVQPALVLLDEPYSALDPILREGLRAEVAHLIRSQGRSALHVTHDPDEALAVADRLIVLGHGKVIDQGAPERVYAQPTSLESARALGRLNEWRGSPTVNATVTAWRWEDGSISGGNISGGSISGGSISGGSISGGGSPDRSPVESQDTGFADDLSIRVTLERLAPMRGSRLGVFRVRETDATLVAPVPQALQPRDQVILNVPAKKILRLQG